MAWKWEMPVDGELGETRTLWHWQVPQPIYARAFDYGFVQMYYDDDHAPQPGDEVVMETVQGTNRALQSYTVITSALMLGVTSGRQVLRIQLRKTIAVHSAKPSHTPSNSTYTENGVINVAIAIDGGHV